MPIEIPIECGVCGVDMVIESGHPGNCPNCNSRYDLDVKIAQDAPYYVERVKLLWLVGLLLLLGLCNTLSNYWKGG